MEVRDEKAVYQRAWSTTGTGTVNTISIQYYKSPVGEMVLGSYDNKLCLANWSDKKKSNRDVASVYLRFIRF